MATQYIVCMALGYSDNGNQSFISHQGVWTVFAAFCVVCRQRSCKGLTAFLCSLKLCLKDFFFRFNFEFSHCCLSVRLKKNTYMSIKLNSEHFDDQPQMQFCLVCFGVSSVEEYDIPQLKRQQNNRNLPSGQLIRE